LSAGRNTGSTGDAASDAAFPRVPRDPRG
jgi:hypothetical protein